MPKELVGTPKGTGATCLLFLSLSAVVSEEIQACLLGFRQLETKIQLGGGKSNLNTVCNFYFQAE